MNQLHQDIIKKANAQKLPTNYHLLLKKLLCTRQLKIQSMLLAQYYKNYEEKKSWWKFQIKKNYSLRLTSCQYNCFCSPSPSDKNAAIMIQLCKWYYFPSYCTCLGFLWWESPTDLRQTNTELDNSCFSTPAQDTHSTSLRAVTINLYWIRPLVFLISNLGEKKNS